MNFILKFLEKRFANEENVQSGFDAVKVDMQNILSRLDSRVDITDKYFEHLGKRISALEAKYEHKLSNDNDSWLGKDPVNHIGQPWSTTNAIIDVLTKQDGKKLHYSSIYALVKGYNLINPNVKIHSLKTRLYSLARQNRISLCNDTEKCLPGTFFIKT